MSGSTPLAKSRCELHPEREAAVRCPSCRRDYCRECVVEHGGRLLCRRCLARDHHGAAAGRRRRPLAVLGTLAGIGAGVLVAWLCFYFLGRALALLPWGVETPVARVAS